MGKSKKSVKIAPEPIPDTKSGTTTTVTTLKQPPALPEGSYVAKWTSRFVACIWLGALAYGARQSLVPPHSSLVTFAGGPLIEQYTGLKPVDSILSKLVSAFSFLTESDDPAIHLQLRYFAHLLGAAVLLWTIEGWRTDHRPSSFLAAAQLFGVGLVAPVYFSLAIMSDAGKQLTQSVPSEVAQSVLPGVLFGYFVPSLIMGQPTSDPEVKQKIIAFWQGSPVYAGILTAVFAAIIKRVVFEITRSKTTKAKPDAKSKTGKQSEDSASIAVNNDDSNSGLPMLRVTYAIAFVAFAAQHLVVGSEILSHPDVSFERVLLDLPYPLSEWDTSNPTEAMFIFMKFDLMFFALSVMVYLHYTIWNLTLLGCIKGSTAVVAYWAVTIGQVLVGPAATYVGLWFWREEALARKKKTMKVE